MKKEYKLSLVHKTIMLLVLYFVGRSIYFKIKSQGVNLEINTNNLFYILVIISGIYSLFYLWFTKITIKKEGIKFNTPLNKTYIKWDKMRKVDYILYRSFHYHIVLISNDGKKIKISKYVNLPLPSYQNLDQLLLDIYNLTPDNIYFDNKLRKEIKVIKNDEFNSDRLFSMIFLIILFSSILIVLVINFFDLTP